MRPRQVSLIGVSVALSLLVVIPTAAAQGPMTNMIHVVDAKFISQRTEIAPSGRVVVMAFADRDGTPRAHSVTADNGAFDVRLAAPKNASDFVEANFTAPATPGEYAFHDAQTSARGVLVVVAPPGYQAPTTKTTPGAPLAIAIMVVLALVCTIRTTERARGTQRRK